MKGLLGGLSEMRCPGRAGAGRDTKKLRLLYIQEQGTYKTSKIVLL